MRIGITYDLKSNAPAPEGLPDDFQEEFDSPVTIDAIASALRGSGHTVEKLDDGRAMLQRLLADPPDVIAVMRRDYQQPILVEEYIDGDELTVAVVGNSPPEIIGIMRVVPRRPTERFVYGIDVKRDYKRLVAYQCPAPLSACDTE